MYDLVTAIVTDISQYLISVNLWGVSVSTPSMHMTDDYLSQDLFLQWGTVSFSLMTILIDNQ